MDDWRIEDNYCDGQILDGIRIATGGDAGEFRRWHITGNNFETFYASALYGIFTDNGNPTDGTGNRFDHNTVRAFQTGIYARRHKGGTIEGNVIVQSRSGGWDIHTSDARHATINDNICIGGAGGGIKIAIGTEQVLSGNIIYDVDGTGYELQCSRLTASGNSVIGSGVNTGRGFDLLNSCADSTFAGCYAYNMGSDGFGMTNSQEVQFVGCKALNCGSAAGDYGFHVLNSLRVQFVGCYAGGNWDDGFRSDSAETSLSGCYSINNGDASANAADWTANTAINPNEERRATGGAQPTLYFEATALIGGGLTGATEPSWNLTVGGTTVDNEVTWTTRAIAGVGDAMGFNIESSSARSQVSGCYSSGNVGKGYYTSGINTTFKSCYSYQDGDRGFHVNAANGVMQDCYAHSSGAAGFDCQSVSLVTGCYAYLCDSGFSIDAADCLVNGCISDGAVTGAGFSIGGGTRSTFTGCAAINGAVGSGFTGNAAEATLNGCYAYNNAAYGFICQGAKMAYNGCVAHTNTNNGFDLGSAAQLTGCLAVSNTQKGFAFKSDGDDGTASGCVADSNTGYGFDVRGAARSQLSGCLSRDNGNAGYNVTGEENSIVGCRSLNDGDANGDYGIHIQATALNSLVSGCHVKNSWDHGIFVEANFSVVTDCYAMNVGDGTGAAGETDAVGIRVTGTQCKIDGCYVYDSADHGFEVTGANGNLKSCYAEICGSAAGDIGYLISGVQSSVTDCYAKDSFDHGFSVTGNQSQLSGCYTDNCGTDTGDYGFAISAANCQVSGCYAYNGTGRGFSINGTEAAVSGCVSRDNAGPGFHVTAGGDASHLDSCLADNNGGAAYFTGGSAADVHVVGCRAKNTPTGQFSFEILGNRASVVGCLANLGSTGFRVTGTEATVSGCYARDTGSAAGHYGFEITGARTNVLGCHANDSHDHGIYVNAADCQVTGCYVDAAGVASAVATADGIHLTASADNCKITDNYLHGNSNYGIEEVAGCDGNHFADNYYFDNFASAAVWAATTAYALTDTVRATATALPHLYFEATTAGTSGGAEPTWNEAVGGTTTDGTVVWTTRLATASLGGTARTRLDREGTLLQQEGLTEVISVYDAVGGQTLNATPITVNLDTAKVNTRSALYSLAADVITIAQDGTYLFNFHMTGLNGANQASTIRCYLERDSGGGFALETGTEVYGGDIGNNEEDTPGGCIALTVAAGDQFRLRGDRAAGTSSSLSTVANSSVVTITRMGP
jgi:parallel beta-helix repeat protein